MIIIFKLQIIIYNFQRIIHSSSSGIQRSQWRLVHHRLAELGLALQLDGLDLLRLKDPHADLVGEARNERGVDRVVLGQAPLRPRELPHAQCVGVRHGDVELAHEGDELKLVSARRLHADRRLGLSCEVAELPETIYVVVDFLRQRARSLLLRRDVDVELFLGNYIRS